MTYSLKPIGAGGALAFISQHSQRPPMQNNHARPAFVEQEERNAELARLLRAAMKYVARQLQVGIAPSQRTEEETQFLKDVQRDRRKASTETLAALLAIQGRPGTPLHLRHAYSEELRAIELTLAVTVPPCPFEASESETQANGPLNEVQMLAAREKSPTRWRQVIEYGTKQLDATRRLLDAAHIHVGRSA